LNRKEPWPVDSVCDLCVVNGRRVVPGKEGDPGVSHEDIAIVPTSSPQRAIRRSEATVFYFRRLCQYKTRRLLRESRSSCPRPLLTPEGRALRLRSRGPVP
jgi:hypothetical protein